MVSSSSSSPLSLSPSSRNIGEQTLPPSPKSSSDERAARALEALMWPHDLDSTVSESSLGYLRGCFGILEDFTLIAPEPGQRAYDPIPKGFALTIDALEAGLRLPFHPVISSCVSWWRVSPSQIAPNSWRYLVAFLGECHYTSITPTRSLFLSCFRLSRGSGGYYLSARPGFRVSGLRPAIRGGRGAFLRVPMEAEATKLRSAIKVAEQHALDLEAEATKLRSAIKVAEQHALDLEAEATKLRSAIKVAEQHALDLEAEATKLRSAIKVAEQHALDLEAEATKLRSAIKVAEQHALDLEAEATKLRSAIKVAEQHALDLEAEATKLRSAIKVAEQHALDLEAEATKLRSAIKVAEQHALVTLPCPFFPQQTA
ncbi:hypothetical protein C4D60_Mb04t12920 [Musa balbisiana]|uniref:Transposase (putative) gypsy type domain-containing protein n=1 Tax=Musa balbisiana TaxID=52838 RepID=A0A4S8KBM5_MUSBA|nr:hypothetical protein C4D60_Mb04t12920 [Musa balbisiana]